MFLLYEILLYLFAVVAFPVFLIRGLLAGKYLGSFRTRLGRYDTAPAEFDLWLHAVSVGETVAAKTIVDRVRQLRPSTRILITTTTATGQATAARIFSHAAVTYFPFDFRFAVRRFLRHHRPRLFASIETEIWPNTVRLSRNAGLKLLLLNARLSDASFPRYRKLRPFLKRVLIQYSSILAREEEDRRRFVEIGAPPEIVEVCGNVKFDFEPDTRPLEIEPQLRHWMGSRRLFIAGSTMQNEDEMIIPRLAALFASNCLVAIAPRKPERFSEVAALLQSAEIPFTRRSEKPAGPLVGNVLLLDTIGELARLYRFGVAAFIGGSLVPAGGHNPIEPAAVGIPVAFGPHMSNFRDVAATFLADGAAVEVGNAEELIAWVLRMAEEPEARAVLSAKAKATVQRNRGAAQRNAARIVELLG